MPRLQQDYIDTGKVRYIFRPVFNSAPTFLAAEALYCTGEQGRFWEMHDWLFFNEEAWIQAGDPVLVFVQRAALELGLDGAALSACMQENRYRERVEEVVRDAQQRGVDRTPTFLINDYLLLGARPYSTFRQIIEEELRP